MPEEPASQPSRAQPMTLGDFDTVVECSAMMTSRQSCGSFGGIPVLNPRVN
jgi:hypothetical protein